MLHDGVGHSSRSTARTPPSTLCKPGENSKWELAQPVKLKADDSNANALISTLNNLTIAETIEPQGGDPREARGTAQGIRPGRGSRGAPRHAGRSRWPRRGHDRALSRAQSPHRRQYFRGRRNAPAGPAPQANRQVDENKVYLVPTYFKTNFDHDLTYWRDKKLLTFVRARDRGLRAQGPQSPDFRRAQGRQWTLKHSQGERPAGRYREHRQPAHRRDLSDGQELRHRRHKDAKAKAALKGAKPSAHADHCSREKRGPRRTAKEPPEAIT